MQIEHFFSPNSSEDQKKKEKNTFSPPIQVKTKMQIEHFFSPNSGEDQKKKGFQQE